LGLQLRREGSQERELACHDARDVLLQIEEELCAQAAIGVKDDTQGAGVGAITQGESARART
jgi:hypothetical protein